MAKYKIAFTVNGSIMSINAQQVKLGNRFLQCKDGSVAEDQATVAMLPFDAIEYIVLESVSVSAGGITSTENADPETLMEAIEARQSDDA